MKKKNLPPNPLPCGCAAMSIRDFENAFETGDYLLVPWTGHHVVHCPLHASAERMRAALEAIAAGMGNLPLLGSSGMGDEGVHGINDGKARGHFLAMYVQIARDALKP